MCLNNNPNNSFLFVLNKYFLLCFVLFYLPITGNTQTNPDEVELGAVVDTNEIQTDIVVFETLDQEDINRLSKIYGHQIFKTDSSRIFDASTLAKIPDSYVLGEGDEITLSIFGASQYDAKLKIGRGGYVQAENMPRIFLRGLTWGKAKELIKSRYQRYYVFKTEQLALALSRPRVITVNILGEVERPGSYDMVATNTAFNALISAGGPSETGSFRNIRIIKDQEQIELDIYEVMNKPGAQFQFYLEDNIIVQVPVAQKVVEAVGAVRRPLKYELKDDEGLFELIEFAGGLSANAYQEVVQIERFTDNRRVLIDINLAELFEKKENLELENGDVIRIKELDKAIDNVVNVSGAVELPGQYALETTSRISDLLQKGILKRGARLDVAFLIRRNDDNTSELIQLDLNKALNNKGGGDDLKLNAGDRLMVYLQQRYIDNYFIQVSGAVRDRVRFPFDPDSTITIQQAVLLGGGLQPDAADFGYLIRTNQNNKKEKEYMKVNVRAALLNPKGKENLVLQPMDELRIVKQSAFTDVFKITIKGAVRNPQILQFDKSLKLRDLITLAEGFKPEASKKLDVFRLEVKNDEPTKTIVATIEVDEEFNIISGEDGFNLMPNDEIIARIVPEYEEQSSVFINGEVTFPGEYSLVRKNETLADIIRRAGGLTSEAFLTGLKIKRNNETIITNSDLALKNQTSPYNLKLKKGDVITIPEQDNLITIVLANTGVDAKRDLPVEVKNIRVAFFAEKSAKWYLEQYVAGFGPNADKERVFVRYANGKTKKSKKKWFFYKYPTIEKGATIFISKKAQPTPKAEKTQTSKADLPKGHPKKSG